MKSESRDDAIFSYYPAFFNLTNKQTKKQTNKQTNKHTYIQTSHIKLWVKFLVDNGTDTAFLLWAFSLFTAERLFCFPEQKFVRTDAQQIFEREI